MENTLLLAPIVVLLVALAVRLLFQSVFPFTVKVITYALVAVRRART